MKRVQAETRLELGCYVRRAGFWSQLQYLSARYYAQDGELEAK